jgi:hypothetical protein
MKFSITLNKNLNCEHICSIIQKIINDHQKDHRDISNSVLILDIKDTIDSGNNHIPKLTYDPSLT